MSAEGDETEPRGRATAPAVHHPIERLLAMLAALRDPEHGCAWDRAQSHASLAPYALEEAYELVDAIQRGDIVDIRDELGDCLLQVVFHAQVAEEAGAFAFPDVVDAICSKLVRRHPHVVLDASYATADKPASTATAEGGGDRSGHWAIAKARERANRDPAGGVLTGVATTLPGLTRAVSLQARAAAVGFDWDDPRHILAKVREEVDEVEEELVSGGEGLLGEIGDLLFAVTNLARRSGVDPDAALRYANAKFERRFAFIERGLQARGSSPMEAGLDEMEALWVQAKCEERVMLPPAPPAT